MLQTKQLRRQNRQKFEKVTNSERRRRDLAPRPSTHGAALDAEFTLESCYERATIPAPAHAHHEIAGAARQVSKTVLNIPLLSARPRDPPPATVPGRSAIVSPLPPKPVHPHT